MPCPSYTTVAPGSAEPGEHRLARGAQLGSLRASCSQMSRVPADTRDETTRSLVQLQVALAAPRDDTSLPRRFKLRTLSLCTRSELALQRNT